MLVVPFILVAISIGIIVMAQLIINQDENER